MYSQKCEGTKGRIFIIISLLMMDVEAANSGSFSLFIYVINTNVCQVSKRSVLFPQQSKTKTFSSVLQTGKSNDILLSEKFDLFSSPL